MGDDKKSRLTDWLVFLLAIVIFWVILNQKQIGDLRDKVEGLEQDNVISNERLSNYQAALDQANENIEEANARMEEAGDYAWGSYDDMGEALESLEAVDTVSAPEF